MKDMNNIINKLNKMDIYMTVYQEINEVTLLSTAHETLKLIIC